MSDNNDIQDWIDSHLEDYISVLNRLEDTQDVVMHGDIERAAGALERSYLNAVLSIRTDKERHETAFTAHYSGGKSLKETALMTVYGGNKKNWIRRTFESTDWETLAMAVRYHERHGNTHLLLDVIVDNLVGVSYRKGAFMLAMLGFTQYLCIDSNVGRFADVDVDDDEDWNCALAYMEDCREIIDGIDDGFPPFVVQWAIYDFERGEHARHMPFYREVLDG